MMHSIMITTGFTGPVAKNTWFNTVDLYTFNRRSQPFLNCLALPGISSRTAT